jgi:L,D-peptidoglycan transpeptidase YkuD (ErfK/YbiS/YcfS/YnhG family)
MVAFRHTDLVVTPGQLRFRGRGFPIALGRSGVTTAKREGDGATPAGIHRIVGCLYRPDRMARPVDWAVPIGPRDGWSDDPRDPDYNLMVARPHPFSHERLARADPAYDLVLVTDWNWPFAEQGAGSAIFVHRWRAPGAPTAGCVALAADDLRWITRRIGYRSRLIVPPGADRRK